MKMTKAALVFGTAMVLTTAAFAAPGKAKAAFFNKAPVTEVPRGSQVGQDTVKPAIRPLVISKVGKDMFCANNSTDEYGNTYPRAVLDLSPKILMKAARKENIADVDMSDFVGAYNVGGLKILILRFGVIAMRNSSNSRDAIEDIRTFESEIKNVQVSPYGPGKDKWAVITVTTVDGKETMLVLFAVNEAQTLLRGFDKSKDPGKSAL